MTRFVTVFAAIALVAGCKDSKKAPSTQASAAGTAENGKPGGAASPTPAQPDAAPAKKPITQREGGPTVEACEQVADKIGELVVKSMTTPSMDATKRAEIEQKVKGERDMRLRFCVESATPEEAACIVKAADFANMTACERYRRQVPKDLADRDEVTLEDCQKVFDRLRQFKIDEGIDPALVDKDKDQIIRACQDKAKPGTVACFLASRSYEEARRCP